MSVHARTLLSRATAHPLHLPPPPLFARSTCDGRHRGGVCHGDLKAENVLLTSWNWVFVTEFAAGLKPPFLPEDHPADFSFFFNTSGRRSCYIAPERSVVMVLLAAAAAAAAAVVVVVWS